MSARSGRDLAAPEIPPAVAAVLELMAQSPAQRVGNADIAELRAALDQGAVAGRGEGPRVDGVRYQDVRVDDHCSVRVYQPGEVRNPVPLLFIHGGGWSLCSVETHHETAAQLAADNGCQVVSVEYRLAPEHPFPAPLEDCLAAARWTAANAGADRIVVAGDSSGGNLAAAVALASLGDRSLPRVALQVLIYPVLGADLDTSSYRALGDGSLGLSRAQMRWYWDAYAPTRAQREDPLAVPLAAPEFAGLPPTVLLVGDLDPLRDEARAYRDALAAAGVRVEFWEFRGGFHGFYSFRGVLDLADQAAASVARVIGEWV